MEKLELQENVHIIGGLEINEDTVEVSMDGSPVKLTPIEYKIFIAAGKNPGKSFSAEEIYERVWQESVRSIQIRSWCMSAIFGEKIEIDPKNPKYLKGGVGRWIQN